MTSSAMGQGRYPKHAVAVTITPVAACSDSRALKQAASLASIGFQSLLFEGKRSTRSPQIAGVQLISPELIKPKATRTPLQTSPDDACGGIRNWLAKLRVRSTSLHAPWSLALVVFTVFLGRYVSCYLIGGLKHIPPASVYYLHEYSFFPAVWLKSLWHRAILIYDAHDFYSGIEFASTQTPVQRLVTGFGRHIERFCIAKAHGFVTVAPGIAELYEKEFGRRPIVIRNVHDSRIEVPVARSIRARTAIAGDTPIVVIVGHAKRGQTFSGLFTGLNELPTLHAAFVGKGYRELLKQAVAQACVAHRVHFLEDVDAQEVVPVIRDANASILVYYPRSENYKYALPNGFFQSLAAGLPVFYGNLPEIDQICRQLQIGAQIDPDDGDSVAKVLRHVVDGTPLFFDLKQRSHRAASLDMWQDDQHKLEQMISDLLRSRVTSDRD
jgi:glycosyltransferase involved in cell wall biosynthesis